MESNENKMEGAPRRFCRADTIDEIADEINTSTQKFQQRRTGRFYTWIQTLKEKVHQIFLKILPE